MAALLHISHVEEKAMFKSHMHEAVESSLMLIIIVYLYNDIISDPNHA